MGWGCVVVRAPPGAFHNGAHHPTHMLAAAHHAADVGNLDLVENGGEAHVYQELSRSMQLVKLRTRRSPSRYKPGL